MQGGGRRKGSEAVQREAAQEQLLLHFRCPKSSRLLHFTMFLRLVGTGTRGPSHPHPFFSFFIFLFSYTASSPAPTSNKLLLSAILSPQPPVEALHLIFLWPTLSGLPSPPPLHLLSTILPPPRLSTLIPPSVFFSSILSREDLGKVFNGLQQMGKGVSCSQVLHI